MTFHGEMLVSGLESYFEKVLDYVIPVAVVGRN